MKITKNGLKFWKCTDLFFPPIDPLKEYILYTWFNVDNYVLINYEMIHI